MAVEDRAARTRAGTGSRRPTGVLGTVAVAVGRLLLGLLRLLTSPLRVLYRLWRRSIQARVVIGVVVLSSVLASLAGWLLLSQVTSGLLESKQQAALTQAAAGFDTAQARLYGSEINGFLDIGSVLNGIIEVLSPRDEAHSDYSVIIVGPISVLDPAHPSTWAPRTSGLVRTDSSIPRPLLSKVTSTPGSWWSYSRVVFADLRQHPEPGLVVGSQVTSTTGDSYALFYVFPMQEQQQTLAVVSRALIAAGAILVVLIATIAWLVTRQVVTPVRLARRIAERLAAGRLEERMHVRGEDDIARLGTSFNQMATSLQRQIRQLEELSRVQRRFVADVSHELRTPLTTVRMASDLLYEARGQFDPGTARSAELLQAELNRFEGLLTDLLEISRYDAGVVVLNPEEVDLTEAVHRVVDSTSAVAASHNSRLVLTAPAEPAVVVADPRRVERVLRNLVLNAVEYGEGSDVAISVTPRADAVAVTVRDHGIGLKSGEEKLVFTRFWRADPARARTRGGTGLGLSIASEDAALHGGVLDALGEPGRGSVFRLTLPRQVGQPFWQEPLGPEALADPPNGRPAGTPRESLDQVGAPYAHFPQGIGRGPR